MGYRGKLGDQAAARDRRAEGWTLADIAADLGVSKSSVSLWVRDVEFEPRTRARARRREPNALQQRKAAEIEQLLAEGRERIGRLSDRDLLIAGTALYAGEGSKNDRDLRFSNSDPRMVALFCAWLRRFFDVDESRLRVRLYLHEGLDVDAAVAFWSALTAIPAHQFGRVYRARPDPSIRKAKHEYGCIGVVYSCARTHRTIMGLVSGLLSCEAIPG